MKDILGLEDNMKLSKETITIFQNCFEMEKNELVGQVVLPAIWDAYNIGKNGKKLDNVMFTGCEKLQNFKIFLVVKNNDYKI